MAKYYSYHYSDKDLKDLSLFVILFSAVMMTVLSSCSNNILNAQAQVLENGQQPQQQQVPSSVTTTPQMGTMPSIEITSHSNGQQVGVGHLTIAGTSSDTPSTECEVYADWNDSVPFKKAIAAGPGGPDDYSKWTFSYDSGYSLIQNGTNNLTSKISCMDGPSNLTKWNSVNLIGVNDSDSGSVINQAITSGLTPPPTPPTPSSTVGLPLPTPSQTDVTSLPLNPVIEVDESEEDEEDSDNDDSDLSSNEDNEGDNDEEGEDNNGSGEDSEDNENNGEENGDGDNDGGNDGDNDEGDNDNGPVDFGPGGPVDFGPDGPVD